VLGAHWLVSLALLAFAAVALWLCGGWAVPWTADAYARRVNLAWRDCAVAVKVTRDGYASHRLDTLFRAQALTPPPGREALHLRLLEILADPHEGASSSGLFAVSRELDALEEGAYGAAWRELRADDRTAFTHAVEREEAQIAALVARLERVRIPRTLASEHARLVAAFREYGDAGRELAAAWATRDTDVVDAAAARLTDAARGIEGAHAAIAR
jgi:hypothetical protein